jgi:hypothetical protein
VADEPSPSSYYGLGLSNTPVEEKAPTQDLGGRLQDTALDTVRGGLGIVRDIGGLKEMGAVSPEQRKQARSDMDEMGKIDYWLQRARSPAGRYRAEHPEAKTAIDTGQDVVSGIAPYVPLAAAGPAAPGLFGALALGHQRVDIRDRLRDTPDDKITEAAQRAGIDQSGKSTDDLRDELYGHATDPTKLDTWLNAAPAVVGNVIGAGALGVMTKGAMRTLSGSITDRVLANINQGTGVGAWAGRRAIGAATGGVGGAAMGGGGAYTQEATEAAAGLRPEGVNWGDVAGAAKDTGLTFGAIGAVTHGRQPAPPIGTDTVTVARMQEQGYGRPGPIQPRVEGGRPMETGDIMDPLGPEGPARTPATGGVPMHPGDVAYQHPDYGPADETAGAPATGGRPVQQGDVYDPMGYQPPPGTAAQRWTPPPPPKPLPPPGGGGGRRQMRQGDIMDEMGPAGPRVVGRTINERPMVQGDIYGEYGPEGARMARRPARGPAMQQGDLYGEYGPERPAGPMPPPPRSQAGWRPWEAGEREAMEGDVGFPADEHGYAPPTEPEPPGPRPFPEGGETPSARGPTPKPPSRGGGGGAGGPPRGGTPRGGAPEAGGREAAGESGMRAPRVSAAEFGGERAEPELPYPERATLRKKLAGISPQIRGVWARKMTDAMEHGQSPLEAIPVIGRRMLGEHAASLMRDHPQGVIAEIGRGVREVPREGTGLTPEEHGTLQRLIEKASPEERAKWAAALESGKKYLWAKMPKSWKDAVKGMEKDVHDLVTKNSRAVIDELRPRDEQRYEEAPYEPEPMREAEAADIGEHTPTPEGEQRAEPTHGEAEGKAEYEGWQENREGFKPSEYGPEIEPGQRPFRAKGRRVAETIGLTRRGEYAPDTRGRMQEIAGVPFRVRPGQFGRAMRAGMGRLAPAPALQRIFAKLQKGPEAGLYPPELPGARSETARQERFYGARRREQIARDERLREQARLTRSRQRDLQEATAIVKDVMGDTEAADVFFHDLGNHIRQLVERTPMMQAIAKGEARRAKEAARKQGRTKADFNARERTLNAVLLDPEMSIDNVPADFFKAAEGETSGRKLTMRNWLDEVIGPAGLVRLRPTEEMTAGMPHEVALDSVGRGDLVAAARRIADMLRFHVESGDAALRKLYAELYPPDSRRQPQISFRIGTHKSGLYPAYDILSDFKSRAAHLEASARAARGKGGMNAVVTLRNQMLDAYMRLRFLSEGRLESIKELDRQTDGVMFEDMQREKLKQEGIIEDYNRTRDTLQNMYRQATEAGENTKRGMKLIEQAQALGDRLRKMASPELAQRRLDQYYMAKRAMEEMQAAAGRSMAAFADVIHDWIDDPVIQRNQRRVIAELYRQRFGETDRLPHDEQVQLSRERAQGSSAAYEMSLRDKRTREQIEGSKQEVAQQEAAQPKRTRAESEAAIHANEARVEELLEARNRVPDEIKSGEVRSLIDTLRYYLRTPEDQLPMRQPEKTRAKLDELIRRVDNEIGRLQDDTRTLWENIEPNGKQWDYHIGRVLDPAADVFGTRQRPPNLEEVALRRARPPEPPALPKGAAAYHLSDFFEGARDIRPTGNTPRERLLRHFFGIVDKVVGDAPVIALTPEQYQLVRQARGIADGDHPAFYDQQTHRIFTTKDVVNGPDRARILGHEFMHPLTVAAAERFPEVASRLDAIRKEVLAAYMEPSGRITGGEFRPNDVKSILEGKTQGITGSVHEFVSELFNDDGSLFSALASMPTRPALREQLRTDARSNFLGRALDVIKSGIMKLFMSTNKNRLLNDAVIHSLDLFQQMEQAAQGKRVRPTSKAEVHPFTIEDAADAAKEGFTRAKYLWDQRGGPSGNFLRWHDLNQLGRRAEPGFRDVVAPFERLVNQVYSSTRSIIEKSNMPDMLKRLAVMSRLPAERWREFNDFINDENYHGADASIPLHEGDNAWVSRDAEGHSQIRDNHAALQARWQRLSPEMKAMRQELKDFARTRHEEQLNANLNRVIDAKGLAEGDPAMAAVVRKHILEEPLSSYEEGKLAEAQKTKGFDDWVDSVRSIPAFKKLPGVWYPMFRRGQWVTEGLFNLAKHATAAGGNAQEINRGEWQFDTPEARSAFLQRMKSDPAMQGVKLLRVRDVGYEKGEDGGIKLTDGKPKRIKRGPNAVERYRAEFNPLLLEFHDSKFNAAQRHAEVKQRYGSDIDMTHTEPVRDRGQTYLPYTKATAAMEALKKSLQGSEGYQNMSEVERSQFTRDLDDAAIRHLMSSTARATYLPRRYALGADKDLMKNFLQYGNNTARTLAETIHHEEIRSQVKKLDKYVEDNKRSGSPGDPEGRYGTLRRQIQNQIHSVLAEHPDPNTSGIVKKGLARILQISYIDRLMSPSFLLLNSSEPWVLGLPLLSGHHGFLNSSREIGRAYKTVAALKLLAKGGADFKDVVKGAVTGESMPLSDNLQLLRESIKNEPDAAQLSKLFDYVDQHGYFDRNAGMELEQMFNPDAGLVGRTADYIDQAFRQVNNQVENINRGVTAIASYRLGLQKGWSHEQAMAHAKDMMHDVNGNYAAHASPAIFRNPWLKPALQFRRYGHRIVSNYVRLIATAFGRNVKPEDRSVAMKQLAIWTASQVAVSGVLGLPTEPIKAVVNGLHLAGVTNFNFDDVEGIVRNAAADQLGPELGMALTRGVLRNVGLGIGTRMGYDTLATSGNVENWKEVPGALFKMLGGSPASMAMDIGEGATAGIRGLNNWSQGFDSQADRDFGEFIEKGIPIKAAHDVYQAWSQAVGGRKSETKGGQPLGYDPTWMETALAATGIRSARQQEASDYRTEFYTKQRRDTDRKNQLLNAYAMAETQAEKMRVLNHVVNEVNPTLPPELKISVKQLAEADARRRQRGGQPGENMGLPINKRTRALLPRPDVYNAQ